MSERRRAGRAGKAAKAPRRNLSANARRVADAMRNRGVGGPLPRRPRGENPGRKLSQKIDRDALSRGTVPPIYRKKPGPDDVVASQLPRRRRAKPKPPRRKRPGPITSPGGSLPVDPKQKPMPRKKPGPITGKPVPPPGGKPPMQKPMPVMPGPVVGKPVPAPPPGSNPPMPGIKPKPPGGFRKGGTVGGAKKKGKAKIRGAGIERKGLRKAKMY